MPDLQLSDWTVVVVFGLWYAHGGGRNRATKTSPPIPPLQECTSWQASKRFHSPKHGETHPIQHSHLRTYSGENMSPEANNYPLNGSLGCPMICRIDDSQKMYGNRYSAYKGVNCVVQSFKIWFEKQY